jgi:hypothetical protein
MAHIASTTKVENASTATSALTLTAAVSSGHTLLAAVCWEASGGAIPTINSVVDSRSNSWTTTPDVSVVAGTTLAVAILRARVTTALQVGDTITITLSAARTRWAWQVDEFDDVNASTPKDQTVSNAPGSSASLSTGTTSATAQNYELLYAVYGFGTGRTVTVPAGWSGGSQVATSAGSTDRAMQAAWKYSSTLGAQQGTLTLSTASTYAGALGTYKATNLNPAVGRVSQVKLQVPFPDAPAVGRISQVRLSAPVGVVGVARVAQMRLRLPTKDGQAPYSGIKFASTGEGLVDSSISVSQNGEI